MNVKGGTGNTMSVIEIPSCTLRRALVCLSLVVAGCGAAKQSASRQDSLPATAAAPERADSGATAVMPTGAGRGAKFAVSSEDDCSQICTKLLTCHAGPWDQESDCVEACGMSTEDETSGATYSCVAKSEDCEQVRRCGS
jgi:hypothetical protein